MKEKIAEEVERPNEFWRKIYAAVVLVTFAVVTALWAFAQYFK